MDASLAIVLIDDNPAWRETLAEFLRDKGFQVQTAQEGLEGLALLEDSAIHLAVVDFNMPGMDGLELLRQLRQRGRNVSVLLLSSDDDPTLPERARAEGARAFLSKTTPPRRLLHQLRETLLSFGREVEEQSRRGSDRLLPVPRSQRCLLPVPILFYRRLGNSAITNGNNGT